MTSALRKIRMPNAGIMDGAGGLNKAGHHYLEQLQQVPLVVADIQDAIDAVGTIGALAGLDSLDRPHLATGFGVIQLQSHEIGASTAYINSNTVIPFDDTIPQNTEGDQLFSGTYTPVSLTSEIYVEFWGMFGVGGAAAVLIAALFQDNGADAVSVVAQYVAGTVVCPLDLMYRFSPASLDPITFSIRFGPSTNVGTSSYLNGNSAGRLFGGITRAYLRVSGSEVH